MESTPLLDWAGRRRSPATTSSFHQALPPRNKGMRYPPDPPTVEEIVAVMRATGDAPEGVRLRGIIVVLWRAGLRISEALALNETDLDPDRGSVLGRHGKGDKRREVGMDRWAWSHLEPWLELRKELPVGRLFCIVRGPTRGRACTSAGIRAQLHQTAAIAGVRRRFAPHQLRHAHAVEMSREGISLLVIQRQLGHADLAITSRYLRGIDNTEIIAAVHERPAPMIPADPRTANRAVEPEARAKRMWPLEVAATYAGAGPLSLAEDSRSRCAVGGNRASYAESGVCTAARRCRYCSEAVSPRSGWTSASDRMPSRRLS